MVFTVRPFSFLQVSCGELVIVFHNDTLNSHQDWWVGEVIHVVGSARGPEPSMFQIACIDTGIIRMVNADLVIDKIKLPAPQQKSKKPLKKAWATSPYEHRLKASKKLYLTSEELTSVPNGEQSPTSQQESQTEQSTKQSSSKPAVEEQSGLHEQLQISQQN